MSGPTYRSAAEVEELVVELVRAVELDGETDHRQGSQATWTESELPATAALPPTARHLEFSVSIESLTMAGVGRDAGAIEVQGELAVVFWYRLRAGSKRSDTRAAARLAADVLAHLARAGVPGVDLVPATIYRPGRPVGEWLPIEVRWSVLFELSL